MKKIITTWKIWFVLCVILLVVVMLSACDNQDPESKGDVAIKKLTAKTWTLQSASLDGTEITNQFAGLALNFTSTGFTVANENILWPSGGTWAFTDASATAFIRGNDQLEIRILELTRDTLKVELTWTKTTFTTGRAQSVSGVYLFVFG